MVTRRAERSIATNGRLQSSRLRTRRAAHAAVRPRIDSWSWRRRGDSTPNYACMRETRSAPVTPGGEDSRPPIRAPASALRRARPPPSDGGRAPDQEQFVREKNKSTAYSAGLHVYIWTPFRHLHRSTPFQFHSSNLCPAQASGIRLVFGAHSIAHRLAGTPRSSCKYGSSVLYRLDLTV